MRDTGFVVRDGDHGGTVFLHQRQHGFQPVFFTGDRIDERLALVHRQPGFQRGHDGGVDGQGHVGHRLHQLNRPGQHARLVGQRNTGVHVEHVGTGRNLGQRIGDDAAVIVGQHLGRHDLAPGRVDALADDDKRAVKADHDFARR